MTTVNPKSHTGSLVVENYKLPIINLTERLLVSSVMFKNAGTEDVGVKIGFLIGGGGGGGGGGAY